MTLEIMLSTFMSAQCVDIPENFGEFYQVNGILIDEKVRNYAYLNQKAEFMAGKIPSRMYQNMPSVRADKVRFRHFMVKNGNIEEHYLGVYGEKWPKLCEKPIKSFQLKQNEYFFVRNINTSWKLFRQVAEKRKR